MIREVSGDILLSEAEVVAHGIAANDPMNQGLALQLHEQYPAMHKDFHHWCHLNSPKPGSVWLWSGAEKKRVANLITQEGGLKHGEKPGPASTTAVNKALRELKKIIEKENIGSVSLPKIATGVGGLSWDEVRPLVDKHLGELECSVFLYTDYKPQTKAEENS